MRAWRRASGEQVEAGDQERFEASRAGCAPSHTMTRSPSPDRRDEERSRHSKDDRDRRRSRSPRRESRREEERSSRDDKGKDREREDRRSRDDDREHRRERRYSRSRSRSPARRRERSRSRSRSRDRHHHRSSRRPSPSSGSSSDGNEDSRDMRHRRKRSSRDKDSRDSKGRDKDERRRRREEKKAKKERVSLRQRLKAEQKADPPYLLQKERKKKGLETIEWGKWGILTEAGECSASDVLETALKMRTSRRHLHQRHRVPRLARRRAHDQPRDALEEQGERYLQSEPCFPRSVEFVADLLSTYRSTWRRSTLERCPRTSTSTRRSMKLG